MATRRGIKMGSGRDVPRSREWPDYDRAVGNDVVPSPVPLPLPESASGRQFTSAQFPQPFHPPPEPNPPVAIELERMLDGLSPAQLGMLMELLMVRLSQQAAPRGGGPPMGMGF